METALTTVLNYAVAPVVIDKELPVPAYYDPGSIELAINPDFPDHEAFAAIAAEVAQSRFPAKGANPSYNRDECELDAQSVSYILCRRFGIDRPMPDLNHLPELYDGWDTQERRQALDGIQDLSKKVGRSIDKNLEADKQRTRTPPRRPDMHPGSPARFRPHRHGSPRNMRTSPDRNGPGTPDGPENGRLLHRESSGFVHHHALLLHELLHLAVLLHHHAQLRRFDRSPHLPHERGEQCGEPFGLLKHLHHAEVGPQVGLVRRHGNGLFQTAVGVDQTDSEGIRARPYTAAGDLQHLAVEHLLRTADVSDAG